MIGSAHELGTNKATTAHATCMAFLVASISVLVCINAYAIDLQLLLTRMNMHMSKRM